MSPKFNLWRLLSIALGLVVVGLLAAAANGVFKPQKIEVSANSIMLIAPYKYTGTWVVDDDRVGLVREPFVAGMPEMIEILVKEIPQADQGFRLLFSAQPFPGHQQKLTWLRGDKGGNYYKTENPAMEGWICPALFRYYREAPKELYVKAEAKS
jgi:hypothetical protein